MTTDPKTPDEATRITPSSSIPLVGNGQERLSDETLTELQRLADKRYPTGSEMFTVFERLPAVLAEIQASRAALVDPARGEREGWRAADGPHLAPTSSTLVARLRGRADFFERAPVEARVSNLSKSAALLREAAEAIALRTGSSCSGSVEAAAKVADDKLREWAEELFATRDQYIEAQTSGTFQGRRIAAEQARTFARDFGQMAQAVLGCTDFLPKAIRTLSAPSTGTQEPEEWTKGNIADAAPHAAYCDVALGDAQIEVIADGERIWMYDDALFDKSLAGNGYKVVPTVEMGAVASAGERVATPSSSPDALPVSRNDVIEQCAKVADRLKEKYEGETTNVEVTTSWAYGASMAASAIRALKSDAPAPPGTPPEPDK